MNSNSVVVTGAALGIGRGISQQLLAHDWQVVGLDRNEQALAATAADLGQGFHPCLGSVTDRRDLESARDLALSVAPLRGWVNNAGIEIPTTARNLDEQAMRQIIEVNLIGTLLGCAVAIEHWLADHTADPGARGAVVNISSVHAQAGFPDAFVYASTKGAIDALTRQAAIDEGGHGIRVNAIRPGAVMTTLTESFLQASPDPDALLAEYAALHPQLRMIDPTEIGSVAAFLLSADASMVNGQSLAVDGGASARIFAYPRHD